MSSVQWIEPVPIELLAAPVPAAAPARRRRFRVGDAYAALLVLAIVGLGIAASIRAVEEYRWEKAAVAAFEARQTGGPAAPPLFDRPAREHLVADLAGGALVVVLELTAGWLLRRHARALARRGPRPRQPRPRPRTGRIVVTARYRDIAPEAKPRRTAADRVAVVVWSDRAARREATPGGG